LSITNLDENELNTHLYSYEGVYYSEDITERPYSYRFDLYDNDNKLIDTSGDLLHNSSNDEQSINFMTRDAHTFGQDLSNGRTHYIKYSVKTINNLETSIIYRITQKRSI
jgi:hypothetical protein